MAYETSVAIIGSSILFFFGMMVISTNDKHPMLKLVYILLGLSTVVALLGLSINIANENGATAPVITMLSNMLWIGSTVNLLVGAYYLYYIVIWVIAKITGMLGDKKARKWGEDLKS